MPITPSKFNQFVADIANKKHNLGSDVLNLLLTNTVPNAADTIVDTTTTTCTVKSTSNALEIAVFSGYSKGGPTMTITSSTQSSGTYKLIGQNVTITSTEPTNPSASFRYIVMYNNTGGTSSTRPVIVWWDYGSSTVLNPGDSFTIEPDGTNGVLELS